LRSTAVRRKGSAVLALDKRRANTIKIAWRAHLRRRAC
jgi:hypothetical protein